MKMDFFLGYLIGRNLFQGPRYQLSYGRVTIFWLAFFGLCILDTGISGKPEFHTFMTTALCLFLIFNIWATIIAMRERG